MKNEAKIMKIIVIVIMLIAVCLFAASMFWLPSYFMLVSYAIASGAIKIYMLKRHPFVIQKFDLKSNEGWVETLVYSYSIKWLKFIYFYPMVIKKNYPVIYHFVTFESLVKSEREELINKYFANQS